MTGAKVTAENAEATDAWNGPLFEVWRGFQPVVVGNAKAHGDAALADHRPEPGSRILDLGCGLGDSTAQLAEMAGPNGFALGIDSAERMIEAAREDAKESGVENVAFEVVDAMAAQFDEPFDYVFGRFGTMFFANPVATLRNVRAAMAPGARLNMVVWRRKLDNPWLHRGELIVEQFLERPEEYDDPTCGPGPFSMANADTVTDVLKHAGFENIQLKRQDIELRIGDDLESAVDLVMAIGPGAEVLRLWGDRVEEIRPKVRAALLEGLADIEREDGAYEASSSWAVRATNPQ